MRAVSHISGIAILTALVLMGAGCTSSIQTTPIKSSPPTPAATTNTTTPPSSASGTVQTGTPVTGYEPALSDPSQK